MVPSRFRMVIIGLASSALLGAALPLVGADQSPSPGNVAHRQAAPKPGHQEHGTPSGWKFMWPKGDPVRGREAFLKLECHSCHDVQGEAFPSPGDPAKVGPELSQMGPLHDPEYLAEAIINPNAVIEKGKGYEAPDGSSKMPGYNDSVTVQEVVDLVAFLRSLRPPAAAPAGHGHREGRSKPSRLGGWPPVNAPEE